MALAVDLTARPPPAGVRIPKLKYRNPPPAVETVSPVVVRTIQLQSPDTQKPPATPSTIASADRPSSFESLTSSSLASTESSASSSNGSKSSSKTKKKGSMLGFLSLKEPSQIALEQYAEAQRKQATESGSSTPTSSSRPDTSYSTKKLPANVPKVNSKWDGVPETTKHRHSGSGSSKTKNRLSGFSSRPATSGHFPKSRITSMAWNGSKLSVMTDGTRNPPNSLASPVPSNSDLRGQSTSPSPSSTTLPEMSYYFPEPLDRDAPSAKAPQVTNPPASLVTEVPPRPSVSSSDFHFQSDQHSERSDSPASSEDSNDTVVRDTADVIFNKLNDRPHKSIWGDVQSLDVNMEAIVPESHDFLFGDQTQPQHAKADSPLATSPMASPRMASPPATHYVPTRPMQNFSRPTTPSLLSPPSRPIMTPSYRTSRTSSGLPTLYEASLASTESDETESDETIQEAEYEDDDDAYSIAPSTIAPSILSSRWHDSPRERLGLGGRLRMNGGLPWDDKTEPPGKPKKHRLSMFSRG